MKPGYIVEIDETYRYQGVRAFLDFDFTEEGKEAAVLAYNNQRKGMVNITVCDGKTRFLLSDEEGRKYAKGSPFYSFPHVPHISIVDGKEIPST